MTKKEYILMVLNTIEKDRPLATDLKKFVSLDTFSNDTMDGLIAFFQQSINTVKDTVLKEKLQKSAQILAKIQEMEKEDLLQNEQECQKLEEMFQHL